jgi:hypothetical protein
MKREATQKTNFGQHTQKGCLEPCREPGRLIDVAPILLVSRVGDMVDEFVFGLARVAMLNFVSLEMTVEIAWR